jgi:hypothetical protein
LLLLTPTFLLLLNKPTISEAYKSTGLTVWSNICIKFGAEQGMWQGTKQIICKNKQYIIFFAVEFHSQDHSAIVYSK